MTPLARQALEALALNARPIVVAEGSVPPSPGVYAIYGGPAVWEELGLGEPPDDRPLYVGKSDSSLLGRDLRQHFGDGRTGSSTVRRSFAALLKDRLGLRAIPRNPAKPERFANYGLSAEDDRNLTAWMRDRLQLAVWVSPPGTILGGVESEVIQQLKPPLNLTVITTPWSAKVGAARAVMAARARSWAASVAQAAKRSD